MTIKLEHISKKFEENQVIKDLTAEFVSGERYVILGTNGSGKSTLIKILSGLVSPASGHVTYQLSGTTISRENVFHHISLASPWSDPVEEFTLAELLDFYRKFRPFVSGLKVNDVIDISGLEHARNRQIHHYSSGMKQRVRLLLAILTQSDLLLLDEPLANVDAKGMEWYRQLVEDYGGGRTIIVASNHHQPEYVFCQHHIELAGR